MKKLNGCILLKTVPTKVYRIVEEMKKIEGVRKCFVTYGRFDIVAFIEVSNYEEARKLSTRINELDGVRSTETLIEA